MPSPIKDDNHSRISKANRFRLQRNPLSTMNRQRRSLRERNPALAQKLADMRIQIQPILHIRNGTPAPDYPSTQLSLFCLTEAQLDAIALYYDQSTTGGEFQHAYPATMDWSKPFLENDPDLPTECKLSDLERLKVKMRMFARFIGMRGAETPGWEYERQVEILSEKVRRQVREEEERRSGKGVFRPSRKGPETKGPKDQ